jgi:hypothetical protein
MDDTYDWDIISSNPHIILQDIIDKPNLPWSWWGLSSNPNITFSFFLGWVSVRAGPASAMLCTNFEGILAGPFIG